MKGLRDMVFVDISGRQTTPKPYVEPDLTGLAKQGPDGQLKVPRRVGPKDYQPMLDQLGLSPVDF